MMENSQDHFEGVDLVIRQQSGDILQGRYFRKLSKLQNMLKVSFDNEGVHIKAIVGLLV